MKSFEHYRVGGCVRDSLLGREAQDVDYVVIGESPDSMKARGFQQVGHFPVFLHPDTQDEYALARSERSTGDGYADFDYVWEGVSLHEDLKRRDLTINAMAMTDAGEIIDPHNGRQDLAAGLLRHVSEHFVEDPLRVLRVARFAARYGFTVADETRQLMTDMVKQGMLGALSAERLWAETEKALMTRAPRRYFEVLDDCGALEAIFPELHVMKGVPQRADYHAEGDVWIHTLMVLDEAVGLTQDIPEERALRVRVAALLHDLGKPNTPHEYLYNADGSVLGMHPGHDDPERFEEDLHRLANRICMPTAYTKFAKRVAIGHQDIHRIRDMSGRGLVNLYDRLDLARSLRHDEVLLDDIVLACTADNLGRRTLMPDGSMVQPTRYRQGQWFKDFMLALHELPVGTWMQEAMARCDPFKPKRVAAVEAGDSQSSQTIEAHAPAPLSPAEISKKKKSQLENAKSIVMGQRRGQANQLMSGLKKSLEGAGAEP